MNAATPILSNQAWRYRLQLSTARWTGPRRPASLRLMRIRQRAQFGGDPGALLQGLPLEDLHPFASSNLNAGQTPASAWMQDGILINLRAVGPQELAVTFQSQEGRLREHLLLEEDSASLLLLQVPGRAQVICAAFSPLYSPERGDYNTVYKGEWFTIHSRDSLWREPQGEGRPLVFHQARAMLRAGPDQYLLTAEQIEYFKEFSQMSARRSTLYDADRQALAEGERIVVTLSGGQLDYQVKD